MTYQKVLSFITLCATLLGGVPLLFSQQQTISAPKPDVPEVFTLMGQFVRVAYNNEGYATLGYRAVQQSIGGEWILLRTGFTLRKNQPGYVLKREHLSLKIPDGTVVPLATQQEFNKAGGLRSLVMRDSKIHDSIDYFPADVTRPCAVKFFNDPGTRGLAWDQVELSSDRACLGRLFFKVPGGIVPGQYWLNVQFAKSMVQVPFRVMTEAEEKEFRENWQEIKEWHEESMKQ
jgi:hypothetical protein